VVEARVRFTNTTSWGAGVVLRYNPTTGANYSAWLYQSGRMTIERYSDWFNTWQEIASTTVTTPGTNWQTLKLVATNSTLTAWLNGTQRLQVNNTTLSSGRGGLTFWSSGNPTYAEFDDFSFKALNKAPKPTPTQIVLSWLSPNTNGLLTTYEIWSAANLNAPFTLLTTVTNANSYSFPISGSGNMRFFRVLANTYSLTPHTNRGTVTLAWDYICGTSNDVTGYRIYVGNASRAYSNVVSVSMCTNRTGTVSNIIPGVTYYFAATALAESALESDYSDELTYTASAGTTNLTSSVFVPQRISLQ
jgi:hypothetical protein